MSSTKINVQIRVEYKKDEHEHYFFKDRLLTVVDRTIIKGRYILFIPFGYCKITPITVPDDYMPWMRGSDGWYSIEKDLFGRKNLIN